MKMEARGGDHYRHECYLFPSTDPSARPISEHKSTARLLFLSVFVAAQAFFS